MQWVVNEKLTKWYGWTLRGLRKKMGSLASEYGAPVAENGEEAVKEMSLREIESEMGKRENEMDDG